MNIVLIGMRGSGKTTVGQILARKLGRELVDMDVLISQRNGLSISEIVERYGWNKFRDMEAEVAIEASRAENIVNAAGGGVVTKEENVRELKKSGILVWLEAEADTLLKRTGRDSNRPLLVSGRTQQEDIEITLAERRPLYQRAADLVVNTENKAPEEIANQIIGLLAQRGELPHD